MTKGQEGETELLPEKVLEKGSTHYKFTGGKLTLYLQETDFMTQTYTF